ncbi:helix-turn-helix domain-containing protein [Haloterrigena sp. SYSU A558-1]|uniref:Helix-turn-helix domain-containing protein n=1 Tax=Haloterrigena gelatinilytica TaxID=2741724 RepID=A0ABX2L727_9EURY|nr:helix-turn-helix domain-containing protein [Haloterrigena gelatinilytica]NUC71158.1 helix-turn-helix domain-containing protein [Haloterrigena gelatinilytica]
MSRGQDENRVVEVEFRVDDPSYPFVDVSRTADCRLDLEVLFPHSDGGFVEYFTAEGAPANRILDPIDDTVAVDADLVARHHDGGRVRLHVRDDCVAITVAECGAIPRTVEADGGDGRVVAEVASRSDADELVDRFEEEHPTVTVDDRRRRCRSTPLFTRHDFTQSIVETLTDRQREVFLTAYMNGFYDWPRKREASELAAKLEISPATFSQHLRTAEGKIFSSLLDTDDEDVFIE